MQEIPVTLPSGGELILLHQTETSFFDDLVNGYNETYKLTNPSDVAELDRLVSAETLCYRWNHWMTKGTDYDGDEVDEIELTKRIKEFSAEIRQIKKSLGIDAVARQKASGDGSVPQYWQQLVQRAEAFGIHRNNQAAKLQELGNQIIALAVFSRNCTEDEQRRFQVTPDQVLDWILEVYKPEYEQLDYDFQINEQSMWIRDQ